VLGNCPFHDLAQEHPGLVCGLNVDLLAAMLGQWGIEGAVARLDPAPARCCVVLTSSGS
jgi:predicted ArsR family transcriptional regulator